MPIGIPTKRVEIPTLAVKAAVIPTPNKLKNADYFENSKI